MGFTDADGQTVAHTTDIHLARRIGEALSRSYHGEFSFRYSDGEKSIRGQWHRD